MAVSEPVLEVSMAGVLPAKAVAVVVVVTRVDVDAVLTKR